MIKNVLFITADQWRGDCLSALGHPVVRTPHLDQLAAEGVLFARHYAQATPCSPSRASIHTGMYQHRHRVCRNGSPLDQRFTNMALEVAKLGYRPMLFGYTDTAQDPRSLAPGDPAWLTYEQVLPGYEVGELFGEQPPQWLAYLARQGYQVPPPERFMQIYQRDPVDGKGMTFPAAPYAAEHSETAYLSQRAMDYIASQGQQPWFVHLSWLRPHPPFVAPAPYHAAYQAQQMPLPVRQPSLQDEQEQHPYLKMVLEAQERQRQQRGGLGPGMDDSEWQQLKATYYGMMAEVDDQLGRLMAFLRQQGVLEQTLVIFTSDHGEQLGDHYLLDKQGFYDSSYHIPLIMRLPPGMAVAGRQVHAFTEQVDLLPTVLGLLGGEVPLQADGYSLQPWLQATPLAQWRRFVHWEHDFRDVPGGKPEALLGLNMDECSLAVIRDQQFKYVHFNRLPPLLFDMQQDPAELHNLARQPDYQGVMLEYAQAMLDWRMRHSERQLSGWLLHGEGPTERPLAQRNPHLR